MHDFFFGTVVHGFGKGRDFGFPTANIKLNGSGLYIEKGVYAVVVTLDNQSYHGMLYAGTRPTLNLQEITIEIHIFEFDEDIYFKPISFQIVHKIRDELHFDCIESLIKKLHHDKQMVYDFFSILS